MLLRAAAAFVLAALGLVVSPAMAATSTVSVTFTNGFIGEYANGAQQPLHSVLLGTLNIRSVVISQTTDDGTFGGSQGNDYSVNLTVNYSNGTSVTCASSINWLDKTGNFVEGIGFTTANCNDGYTLSASRDKTYLLRTSASTRIYQATAVGVQATYQTAGGSSNVSGSADTRGALDALNAELGAVPALITGPTGGAGAATSQISVNENQTAVTRMIASEPVTWSITGGTDASKFTIAADGTITLAAAPDFETPTDSNTNNSYVLTVSALDGNGNVTTQTVTVFILDLNEGGTDTTAPTITGPSGSPGDLVSEITVNEGQTGVTQMVASEAVTWTISGGADALKFTIAADGTLTFAQAPDFENPTDTNRDNDYIVEVTATDAAGNSSVQTVTVHVVDINDAAPLITGPSGAAGDPVSAITVNENQTAVTRVTSTIPVTWAITGGNDDGKFEIAADGTITFRAAPDFEIPTDGGTNNTYILTVLATDANGNTATQTITVTVANLDDSGPVITGPSGGAGAAVSALTINEGLTAVTTFTANEPATWSIVGGDDAAAFAIDAATGAITFRTAPDFENPTDADKSNTYIVRVRAVDATGNVAFQTLTVTIINVDEIARKIAEIADRMRGGLRNYAMHSLGDMLSFNEGLVQSSDDADADCGNASQKKSVSGAVNADDAAQTARLGYAKQLSECGRPYRVLVNAGIAVSRFAGDWNSRALGSVRVERKLSSDVTVGLGVMASSSNDKLASFGDSAISDTSVQLNVYGRARLAEKLRGGAFWGVGKSWYNFDLRDDGLDLNGKMSGNRYVYGAMLSGDLVIEGVTLTTDAILSRAVERLGDATLAAAYRGEKRAGIAFAVGSVDTTRLSVPVTGQLVLSDTQETDGRVTKLLLSPGLLCEDSSVDASSMDCGYQLGAKLNSSLSDRGAAYIDYKFESVSGLRRNLIGIGYAHQFGPRNALQVAFDVNHGVSEMAGSDNRAMVRLRLTR